MLIFDPDQISGGLLDAIVHLRIPSIMPPLIRRLSPMANQIVVFIFVAFPVP